MFPIFLKSSPKICLLFLIIIVQIVQKPNIYYCVLLYLYHFEYPFIYQLLKNVYETNNQPLYNFNAQVSNAELFQAQHPNFNIKETLLQKQGGRCYACSNFIMSSDAHNTKLKYKTPLQNGGQNSIDNLGLVCPHCFGFTH